MAQLSGQVSVTAAGTSEALGEVQIDGPLIVKALNGNTGSVYLGNDGAGDVSASTGLALTPGEVVVFEWVGCLSSLRLDAEVDGDGAAWLALDA